MPQHPISDILVIGDFCRLFILKPYGLEKSLKRDQKEGIHQVRRGHIGKSFFHIDNGNVFNDYKTIFALRNNFEVVT